jgi:hypothetical protein
LDLAANTGRFAGIGPGCQGPALRRNVYKRIEIAAFFSEL